MSEQRGYVPPEYLQKVGEMILPFKQRTYSLMQIQPGQKILDVGCGTGFDTVALAKLVGLEGEVVGVDMDEAMLLEADKRAAQAGVNQQVKHQHCDATSLPFETATFDSCRSERVFQHLVNPAAVLAEMVRVTKPGGWVVVMDPDWATLSMNSAETDLERRLTRYKVEHGQRHGFSGRELLGMFRQGGLTDISIESGTFQMQDAKVCQFVVNLDVIETDAVASGLVTAEELTRWHSSLEQAMADGSFFAVMTGNHHRWTEALMDDKAVLTGSHAGIRLIAQLTIFNKGDFERLKTYLQENYADEALEMIAAKTRLAELKAIKRIDGKMRVEQVVAAGEHEVIVALVAERGEAVYLTQLAVQEDFPHKVTFFAMGKMDKVEEGSGDAS